MLKNFIISKKDILSGKKHFVKTNRNFHLFVKDFFEFSCIHAI